MFLKVLLSGFVCFLLLREDLQASYHIPEAMPKKQEITKLSPYIAPGTLVTKRLIIKRVDSAQQEIASYKILYQDGGDSTNWFTGFPSNQPCDSEFFEQDKGLTQPEKYILDLKKAEELGYYRLPISFRDYTIHLAKTDDLIGHFCFHEQEKHNDRIETGLYLIQSARQQGYGLEVKKAIFEKVIDPALDQPYIMRKNCLEVFFCSFSKREGISLSGLREMYPQFKGIFSKCSPWYNVSSLALSHKAGCDIQWIGATPHAYYPCLKTPSLEPEYIPYLISIIDYFSYFNDLLDEVEAYQREKLKQLSLLAAQMHDLIGYYKAQGRAIVFPPRHDVGTLIEHICDWHDLFIIKTAREAHHAHEKGEGNNAKNQKSAHEDIIRLLGGMLDTIEEGSYALLKTNEPYTFLSALDTLSYLIKGPKEVEHLISAEKAQNVLAALEPKQAHLRRANFRLLDRFELFLKEIIANAAENPQSKRKADALASVEGSVEILDDAEGQRESKKLKKEILQSSDV